MNRFIAFTLERKVTVLMLALATVMVGVMAYNLLPLELLPRGFAASEVSIRIPVRSSNPMEVQEQVIRPAEEQIRTIPGVMEIESRAGADNASISVEFSKDVDLDLATAELRDRMERARLQWPEQVKDYRIFRFNLDTDLPVFSFSISLDNYTDEVTFLVEEKVVKPLEAVPGVARVTCWGLLEDQIRVFVDRDRALAQGVGIYQLTQRLRQSNIEKAGGEIEEGEVRYSVRTDARLRGINELKELPVNDQGLRLGQIARIEPVKAVREFLVLSRNKRTLWCQIYKESGANTVEVGNRVRALVESTIAKDPRLAALGAKPRMFEREDVGRIVSGSLDDLKSTAASGAVLALFVLIFFLRRLRLTLIITLSIPLSLMLTLAVIYFGGGTLNMLCMLGITVAIGMLIDNSIVVVENMARYRDQGLSPVQAGIRGASEVGLAITLSTMTTVAAFLPMIFMTGSQNMTFFMKAIGLPLCYAVLASLFVALVFIPLATAILYRGPISAAGGWRHSYVVDALRDGYGKGLGAALKHRLAVLLVVVPLVTFATTSGWENLKRSDFESDQGGQLRAQVELDGNFTLRDAYDVMTRLGDWFESHIDEYGIEHFWCFFSRTGGRFSIIMKSQDMQDTKQLAERLRKELPPEPGVKFKVGTEDGWGDKSKLNLYIYGPDIRELYRVSGELSELLEGEKNVLSVSSDLEEANQELHIIPDREKALRYGVTPQVLRGSIEYGLRGFWFSNLVQDEQEIPLIVEYEGADSRTYAELRDYPITSISGRNIPLSTIASVEYRPGFGTIRRTNGRSRVRLTIDHNAVDKAVLAAQLKNVVSGYALPPGYSFEEQVGKDESEAMMAMGIASGMAIIFVFLLMGILFESFIMPLAVLISIPCSWCGALWALNLTGTTLDFVGYIGIIVLVGIVVNNGIVLIDCAHRLQGEGFDRLGSLIEAGRTRLRPILMTAGTTIVGLLPMAMADASTSQISYKALSRALIGGLFASTVFTLFLVPILYSLLDDLRRVVAVGFRGLMARNARGAL